MAGDGRMTEPNVLGNISPAKFLFDSGNTEIINLFRDEWNDGATISLMHEDAGVDNGQTYIVPASRVFYLLSFQISKSSSDVTLSIQSNTSPDTATGGTTKARIFQSNTVGWQNGQLFPMCVKFVAGEYVTPYNAGGGNVFYSAWGVECDA